ncbi:hypothetical protein EYB53_021600 [Candidatus Chloroploca sp. M-50]|uniref:Uncharacterized protein n=1 Tax=Candidatus Chloroploca mongolica TaxID=2528176 RepID=A0ABS4DFU9_9CHLR|nr:hypothetical protein [Candidatus Chloroploca mongolica]MBP1468321.1 hypothetical protein [Candidatus Chloroploca mongolica]
MSEFGMMAGMDWLAPSAEDDAAEGEDAETLARRAELVDKRRKLVVAVVLGLPIFALAMARDFGLIDPWFIGQVAEMMRQMPGASMAEMNWASMRRTRWSPGTPSIA